VPANLPFLSAAFQKWVGFHGRGVVDVFGFGFGRNSQKNAVIEVKWAIKEYGREVYYAPGTYEWTKDLEEAHLYDDLSSLRKGMKFAHSDAMGANAVSERRETLAPKDPDKLVAQKVKMVPEKVPAK
jgi:hypothetical protein